MSATFAIPRRAAARRTPTLPAVAALCGHGGWLRPAAAPRSRQQPPPPPRRTFFYQALDKASHKLKSTIDSSFLNELGGKKLVGKDQFGNQYYEEPPPPNSYHRHIRSVKPPGEEMRAPARKSSADGPRELTVLCVRSWRPLHGDGL
jgi:hypothetical protein